jgi:uncharacterized protein
MNQVINWFEIPSQDLDRATSFYNNVLDIKLSRTVFADVPHAIFPANDQTPGGAVVKSDQSKPSTEGTLIYLNAPKLDESLSKVESSGGKIVLPKTSIGEQGWMAIIVDTEGNRIGLHTR